MSSSERTSQAVTSGLETLSASSRTEDSIRSPWKVNASSAPPSASRRAIPHAIERLLATPRTSPRLPEKVRHPASLNGFRYPGGLAPLPGSDCTRGAAHPVGCGVGGATAGAQRLRRVALPARPRRPGLDPGAACRGSGDGAGHPPPATAGGVLRPHARGGRSKPKAERQGSRLARVPGHACPAPDAGGGRAEASNSAGDGVPTAPNRPRRADGRASRQAASRAPAPELRQQGLPEHALHAQPRHQPRADRGDRRSHGRPATTATGSRSRSSTTGSTRRAPSSTRPATRTRQASLAASSRTRRRR